jgi:sugar O-acyltransferase (sialic acid O-acetyltransferase NeuD family)
MEVAMKKLVVFGAREIAEVVAFYLDHDSAYEVVAFTVDGAYLDSPTFMGRPVVPFEEVTARFAPDEHDMFIAVSYQKVNRTRAQKFAEAKARGYRLAHYVSSKAHTWPGLEIGDNSFIMEANTIQPFVSIGADTILWAGNHIGHHARIGDHCFLASQVVVSGRVKVGDYCFVGVNATLRDGITVAPGCVIGAGAMVMKDTGENEVYMAEATKPSRVPSTRLPHF